MYNARKWPVYTLAGLLTLTVGCKKEETTLTLTPALVAPTVETTEVPEVMYTTLTAKGRVSDRGSSGVAKFGLCWLTGDAIPTSTNNPVDGYGYNLTDGSFSVLCFGLTPNTAYSVRTFAANPGGTSYGPTKKITTPALSSTAQVANGSYTAQFKFTVVGQQIVSGGAKVSIAGTGNVSFAGDSTLTDEFDYTTTGAATHKVIFTDAKGDKIYADMNTQTGLTGITGTTTFTGGTGRYANIKGTGKNVGPLVGNMGGSWEDTGTATF